MGKSLKGKECGKGICQRKDGLFSARFVNKQGKRTVKCFSTLPEARNWLDDARYADKHNQVSALSDMTCLLYTSTDRAYDILKEIWDDRRERKESPLLNETLEYMDRRTGVPAKLVMRDLVFINYRTGEPAKNSSYDTHLYKLCDEAGINRFCMHALRHTDATRAIESGMQPKVLQKLLGHASIKTTMDRYVHVTTDSLDQAVRQFQLNGVF